MNSSGDRLILHWRNLETGKTGYLGMILGKTAAIAAVRMANKNMPKLAHWLEPYDPAVHKINKTEQ